MGFVFLGTLGKGVVFLMMGLFYPDRKSQVKESLVIFISWERADRERKD